MKFTFGGDAEQTYPQFLDLETGRTLVAEPGKTYNIGVAEGHVFKRLADEPGPDGEPVYEDFEPLPPDERWKPVKAGRAADTPKENG